MEESMVRAKEFFLAAKLLVDTTSAKLEEVASKWRIFDDALAAGIVDADGLWIVKSKAKLELARGSERGALEALKAAEGYIKKAAFHMAESRIAARMGEELAGPAARRDADEQLGRARAKGDEARAFAESLLSQINEMAIPMLYAR